MSSADRTTKISRAAAATRTPVVRFTWPAPPYYEYVDAAPHEGELCLLAYKNGTKATGRLQNFVPEHEALKFHPEGSTKDITVEFGDLLTLQLLNTARLEVHTIHGGGLHAPSERQPFSLALTDGSVFEGETMGHVEAVCGFFLYLPQGAGR
ncbi:MAG: hypothetical protein JOZ85_04490, partial [Betaproteobacteria bacterium]|nr:hypothetical protein [Betaproteobacteria bacterium]